ncbi:Enoyl-(Acyl carrier protein) reductase [Streptosporangium subroseum]|uniref:Enoyl-(Acyl carrier protein) reductase n=1 Tax=Streptosporangium subroseum TaxID=106412 RepID=A0A239KY87_9ACTN|nr:SDR family oxidoreductase [Streptosporangium subroseum]SNT23171.1 Enoyl-(Acyl carrier protein) reductase [Streptosporangium subroseum]
MVGVRFDEKPERDFDPAGEQGGIGFGERGGTDHLTHHPGARDEGRQELGAPHYNASLAARHNLAVSLARDLKDSGVTSNVVSPGAILAGPVQEYLTGVASARGWGETWEEIERAAAEDFVPNDVGRLGRPEEIAAAVLYLTGPLADYVSGATIRVDGGTIRSVH